MQLDTTCFGHWMLVVIFVIFLGSSMFCQFLSPSDLLLRMLPCATSTNLSTSAPAGGWMPSIAQSADFLTLRVLLLRINSAAMGLLGHFFVAKKVTAWHERRVRMISCNILAMIQCNDFMMIHYCIMIMRI